MNKLRVALTIRSFDPDGPAMAKLRKCCDVCYVNSTKRRLTESEMKMVLKGIDGVIAGTEPITREVIKSAESLRVISRVGVGLDSIDLKCAEQSGIQILNTPDAATQPVAEHAVALILALLKRIPEHMMQVRSGQTGSLKGEMLSGRDVGIVGMGRIGRRLAGLLDGFGVRIHFYDPFFVDDPFISSTTWKREDDLSSLLQNSDIVSLHLPAQSDGRYLLSDAEFVHFRPGSYLINTARGSLVDTGALIRALDRGLLAGAGLDVVEESPDYQALLQNNSVIITPHIASNTTDSRYWMEKEAVENIIGFLGSEE